MARIRSLKPEMWGDEALGSVSLEARLLFVGLITQADNFGRFRAAPVLIRGAIFPYDLKLSPQKIAGWLTELSTAGLVDLYTVREQRYGCFPTWEKHQRIDNAQKGLWPGPDESDPTPLQTEDYSTAATRRDSPRLAAGEGEGEGEGGDKEKELSSWRSTATDRVWNHYLSYHPKSLLDAKRRALITTRLKEGWPEATLIAAIDGNHRDPHCNGQNDRGKQYHDIELILRDTKHIEEYAGITTNGKPPPTSGTAQALALADQLAEREAQIAAQ